MSAAQAVLHRVWATAAVDGDGAPVRTGQPGKGQNTAPHPTRPGRRKGMHRIGLSREGQAALLPTLAAGVDGQAEVPAEVPAEAQAEAQAGPRPAALLAPVKAAELRPQPAATAPKHAPSHALTVALGELPFYRRYTEGMLRRYAAMSMESARVPSMLGRELFRGRVTSYRVRSFEDVVIFVHDVNRCLATLSAAEQHLILRIAVQEYTQGEAAAMLGLSLRTLVRRYARALDALSRVFLERRLLEPLEVFPDTEL